MNGFRANLGGGNDFMRFENVNAGGYSRFYGGPGDDSVSFYKAQFEELLVQTFSGDDSVSFDRVGLEGQLRVTTLGRNDTVGTNVLRANQGMTLSTGTGNDRVALSFSRFGAGSLLAVTGEGNDFLGTRDVTGSARVFTGDGADQVSLFNSRLAGALSGQGSGGDEFAEGGVQRSIDLSVTGFEGELSTPNGRTQAVFNSQIRSGVALGTVYELLTLDRRLSTAASAFSAIGFGRGSRFDDAFAGLTETVTVFAPTDEAFAELPDGLLEGLSVDELRDVLNFHVGIGTDPSAFPTGAALSSADVAAADEIVTLLEGDTIDVEQTASGILLDGDAAFVTTDIRAKNGMIQVIDGVLLP